ncbi:hypothetical protein E2C01_002353 [Portunus trituberculatus]|uniref:Uncharacterized protein n=1 Tax=Portunus trituberculatus TaxID=210409 RepID=A0A5B7CM24_PORTR|nr:hypothetical protein [Portunus trituberculatus]
MKRVHSRSSLYPTRHSNQAGWSVRWDEMGRSGFSGRPLSGVGPARGSLALPTVRSSWPAMRARGGGSDYSSGRRWRRRQ